MLQEQPKPSDSGLEIILDINHSRNQGEFWGRYNITPFSGHMKVPLTKPDNWPIYPVLSLPVRVEISHSGKQ